MLQHSMNISGLDQDALQLVNFHDLTHIELIMKVLGLMCDGQYRDMQNFLREQHERAHSINIVGEVTSFLQVFYQSRSMNGITVKILHEILQTLIEMSVGNYANQQVIFNRQIIPIINHILQIDITNIRAPRAKWRSPLAVFYDADQDSDLTRTHDGEMERIEPEEYLELRKKALELKGSAVELLEGMLEETNLRTKELVMEISGGLDIEALHGSLLDFHRLKSDWELIQEEYDDNAERGLFRTYHILMQLNYYGIAMKELGEP